MSNTKSASQNAVDEFFRALSERDVSIASAVLAKERVEIIPLAMAGGTDPERVFDGKDAVFGYLQLILDNFDQVVLVDRQTFITDDGTTVFVEGQGDLISKQTGQPYRNIYVFRFSISDGKITEIREYANPVIYANPRLKGRLRRLKALAAVPDSTRPNGSAASRLRASADYSLDLPV
jgi:ketosteroid isomerase-like protein